MALSTPERITLESVRAASLALTGEVPEVVQQGDKTVVSFTPAQQETLRKVMEGWIDAPSGNLKISWWPIVAPIALRRSLPLLAGGTGAMVLSYFLLRGKHGKR